MLDKVYDPKPVESAWNERWAAARLFSSQPKPGGKRPFVIVIPPPNVTGALHLGHALNNTLQDILIRYHKLQGVEVCWVPGTDHGGIATQNVMEKQLKAEGKNRHQLGREAFLARMQDWTRDCKKTILGQLRRLGCALDWEREAFTMDESRAQSVFYAFEALWKKGLIYRGERMVNWCVRCGTALSDIEVEHEERKGHLWHIHYPLEGGGEGVVVATTRPETMLGDTAVAVNPRDERYEKLVGKKLRLPLVDRVIPIVADESVEFAFGTGAVKVTPAHDNTDFEIGQRHRLDSIKVIGPEGKTTPETGAYAGLSREKAREKVVEDLVAQGFLRKTEDHRHAVGACYRCGQVIEPLLSDQWFVKMTAMAKPTIAAVESGRFKIHPESWAKPYLDWLGGIRDWCVSRQIWWGHRIPVWYCTACYDNKFIALHAKARPVVSVEKPSRCPVCSGGAFEQDPDVLDTWFSSALWPMSVFGWPERTPDLAYYYPTSVLVTGYEILYLWVARMQMMGLEFMSQVPFSDAVIHGIVRDKSGKKMSKSLGNVVDPLVMMDKFGTDALRFALAVQAHPGRDIPFAEESLTGARNFANKIWNSARFVLMNLPEAAPEGGFPMDGLAHCCLELADRWILAEYQAMLALAREKMAAHNPAAAADVVYAFLWDKFCDWYVELSKIRLQGIEGDEKRAAQTILVHVLGGTLKILHPFMPFITEELFAALKPYLGESADFILRARGMDFDFDWSNGEARVEMGRIMEIVIALRTLRSQLNVPPGLKIKAVTAGGSPEIQALLAKHGVYVKTLARVAEIETAEGGRRPASSATTVAASMTFYVPLEGVVDFAQERGRVEKELAKLKGDIDKISAKLGNENFIKHAPEAEVQTARAQHEAALAKQARLAETLVVLGE